MPDDDYSGLGLSLASLGGALDGTPPVDLTGSSSSYRNNNPGNLVAGSFATAHGAIGRDPYGKAIFPDIQTGIAAQRSLWSGSSFGDKPLSQAVPHWVGPDRSYTRALGLDPASTFNQLTPDQQAALMARQQQMEGYYAPYAQGATPNLAPLPPARPQSFPDLQTVPVDGDPFQTALQ